MSMTPMESGIIFNLIFIYVLFRNYLVAVYTYIFFYLESNFKGPKIDIFVADFFTQSKPV
jgi:hypothetical protein